MDIVLIITLVIFVYIFYVSEKFLLQDQGCKGASVFSCKEEDSNHLKGTFLDENETCDSAMDKMRSVLRVNDKTGIWKICYFTAFIVTLLSVVCNNSTKNNKHSYYFYILIFLSTFLILYVIKNFENFHKYKPNTENGDKIIDFINKNCINKFKNSTPVQN
jgi:hypothetical protein